MISESQERMVAVVAARARRRGARGLRALGAAVHGDRRGDRTTASCALSSTARSSARSRPALLTDECPRYEVEQRRPAGRRARPSTPSTTSRRRGCSSSTTSSSARARCGGPGLDAAVLATRRDARPRGVARRPAARRARPVRAPAGGAVTTRALNVACAGGEPLALTDCLNFGNPEQAGDRLGARRGRSTGSPHAAERARHPGRLRATSRSTTRPAAARSRPRRSSAASASSRDVTRIPDRWRRGDRVFAAARRAAPALVALRVAERRTVLARARRLRRRASRSRSARPAAWSEPPRRSCDARRRAAAWSSPCRAGTEIRVGRRRRARDGRLDVRRLRRAGARTATSRASPTSASRAPAPRPGVGRDRRQRERPPDRAARPRARAAGLRRAEPLGPATATLAIGHTRYSTTGANAWANAQPLLHHGRVRTVALGHNGNLVNADELRGEVGKRSPRPPTREVIAALIADDERPLEEAIAAAMGRLEGAATVVGLADGTLFAFRDRARLPAARARPARRRPRRRLGDVRARPRRRRRSSARFARASSCSSTRRALRVDPGGRARAERGALCIFEFFYLARPDTRLAGRRGARGARADGRAARRRGARRGRPRAADPRLRARPPRSASRARPGSRSARG